jgi:predicted nucleotidyltransferase
MGPQTETLDRLLGRTETELCAAKTRESWSLFAILRAAYRARTSDPKR